MATKRLFIGSYIKSKELLEFFSDSKKNFADCMRAKWVEIENLHFTLKFYGDVENSIIPELIAKLDGLLGNFDTEIILRNLSAFPNLNKPRVLHLEIWNKDHFISKLHDEISKRSAELGFEREDRQFKPHLTLARIKSIVQPEFSEVCNQYQSIAPIKASEVNIHLLESKLYPSGPVYKIIK
jgi:2'-5' RNA ligase